MADARDRRNSNIQEEESDWEGREVPWVWRELPLALRSARYRRRVSLKLDAMDSFDLSPRCWPSGASKYSIRRSITRKQLRASSRLMPNEGPQQCFGVGSRA